MKKTIALLMAIMMLLTVSAFAEEAEAPVAQDVYYHFVLDYCPEGYQASSLTDDPEYMLINFAPADETAVSYLLSVMYSEENGDVTMPAKKDLSVDSYQTMQIQFGVDYNEPEFFYFDQTDKNGEDYGVMIIDETNVDGGDLGEIISLWHGYMANVVMIKSGSELTEDDYRTGLRIIQELKVEELK